jgi:hypothetical protein
MMKQIFYNEKKNYVGNQKLRDWTKWFAAIYSVLWGKIQVFSPHDLSFLLIKSKQNYKAKFSTNLILKKKLANIILEWKKPMRKNIVAIDNVLWGKLQCFPQ